MLLLSCFLSSATSATSVSSMSSTFHVLHTPHALCVLHVLRVINNAANTFYQWFQPMASSGFRHGQTGIMIGFDWTTNKLKFDFDGGALTKGETDGSSYPMYGLHDTHTTIGYLAPDTSSPTFSTASSTSPVSLSATTVRPSTRRSCSSASTTL